MPHTRKRYLEPLLEKVLTLSPIAGVLGHRQVGKTTLLNQVCGEYYSLDKPSEQASAEADSENYLKSRAGKKVALDEVQSVPPIFKELKEWVRTHPKPGQFVLSGSVRFTSRSDIKESLSGRIINLELLPFSIHELSSKPNSLLLNQILESSSLKRILEEPNFTLNEHKQKIESIEQYMEKGGLPGVCFIRDEKFRALKIEEQMNTILDRDLRMLLKTNLSLSDITRLLTALAESQGDSLNYTFLKEKTQISVPTIKRLLYVLEALFIIRLIPIEGSAKGHAVYFEDIAEAHHFQTERHRFNESFAHFCFTQLRVPFHYQLGEATELFQYRTRNGVCVPIAFRNKKGYLGCIPMDSNYSMNRATAAANSFLKTYANSKVILLHTEHEPIRAISNRVLSMPIASFV